MTSPDSPARRTRRTGTAAAIAVLFCLAAAAAWFWLTRTRTTPLEPGWPARVVVLAGDGTPGFRDGDAAHARLSDPFGVAIGRDGTVYVSDAGDAHRIRRVSPRGAVSTVAGSVRGFADGAAESARFDTPSGLAIDAAGALYVADTGNNAVRRVDPDGRVTTVAGDGVAGYADGPGAQARFNGPMAVAVDPAGRVIVADAYNDRIRAISADGRVTTVAGTGARGADDGEASAARFDTPSGVAVDAGGVIYVADSGNGALRAIGPGGVATIATAEPLVRPAGVAIAASGHVYLTDDRGRVLERSPDGSSRLIAGSVPGFRDGDGHEARFRRLAGIAVAAPGRLVVADAGNALIRLVLAASQFELRLPPPPGIRPEFDDRTFGSVPLLWPAAPMDGPHEVAGTLGEARGGEGSERFHAGIDVRVEEGTTVFAVRDGAVAAPIATGELGSLNEWLRIGPVTYVHVRAGRTRGGDVLDPARFVANYDEQGTLAGIRLKRGARFAAGEPIATVNAFNHVHLNVGWPGEEHNPLRFRLVHFEDGVPPTIRRGGVTLYDESGVPLKRRVRGRVVVSGLVHVVVDAWDQVDGNRPGRRLGAYAIGYEILRRDGSAVGGFDHARDAIRFDRLALDAEAPKLVYAPGSGIPYYGRRVTRFLYSATNAFRDGRAAAGALDTAALAPGDYTLRVLVADVRGNLAIANRDVAITVGTGEAPGGGR